MKTVVTEDIDSLTVSVCDVYGCVGLSMTRCHEQPGPATADLKRSARPEPSL
jgi:hypothetical protein